MAAPAQRARKGALVMPLLWTGGIALLALLEIVLVPSLSRPLLLVLALFGAAPALLNLAMMRLLAEDWAQALVVLGWTALAGLTVAMTGGITTPLAVLFILPLVAAHSLGGPRLVMEAAVLTMFAVALVLVLAIGDLLPPNESGTSQMALIAPLGVILSLLASAVSLGLRQREGWNARSARLQLLRFAADAQVSVDARGRNLASSALARQILGGARRLGNVLNAADRTRFAAAARRVLQSGTAEEIEVTIVPRPAADASATARRFALLLSPDNKDALLVHMRDISDRTEREERLVAERDAALKAAREKAQFLASVSHELRTPLNAIIGFSDMMKARLFGPLPAKYAEYADLIYDSGRHLVDLVGDVLDVSKIEARRYELDKTGFDARDIVRSSVKLMSLGAEEAGIKLTAQLPPAMVPVLADRKALRQILFNLLSNAIKFTPAEGTVRVELSVQGDDMLLSVKDNGVGMSTEDTKRVGKPWQQAASSQVTDSRGTGLGMALVQSLATLHGGSMQVHSELGTGTSVCVRLPVMNGTAMGMGAVSRLDVRDHIRRAQNASDEIARSARTIAGS